MATALKEQKFVEGIRGCTDRIRQLREESVHGAVPTISMERAVLLTEAYQQYEGTCSIPVLQGKAFTISWPIGPSIWDGARSSSAKRGRNPGRHRPFRNCAAIPWKTSTP